MLYLVQSLLTLKYFDRLKPVIILKYNIYIYIQVIGIWIRKKEKE